MGMIRAGDLTRRIRIEEKVTTQDATYGTEVITWRSIASEPGSPSVAVQIAAQVQDVLPSRSESVRQGIELARNQTRVRIRYRDGIDSSMRIVLLGQTEVIYQIIGGPSVLGSNEGLEFVVERFSTSGGNG